MSAQTHFVSRAGSVPLFASHLDVFGGAERSLLAFAAWLHAQERAVHLVTYTNRAEFAQYANFDLPIDVLHPQGGGPAKVKALRAYFLSKPEMLPPLVSGYQPALHATYARIGKFHCLMHDTPVLFETAEHRDTSLKTRLRTAFSNKVVGFGLRHGETIVTSEFLQRDCLKEFGVHAKIARMGGMVSAAGFVRRRFEGELRLLSVCRIEANKRIDWMLNALSTLEQKGLSSQIPWRLDIVGKGSQLDEMRERTAALGLSDRIVFHGFVSDDGLAEFYDRAHLFVMPAVQGYGIPAVEALARGIPVLLHRDSGVSDILLDTPWASVLHGGEEELAPKLEAMLHYLAANEQMAAPPPPELPTEDAWAARVARICGYV
ncbi:glycosyltransferase family 4 protein [Granulicella cerasi]|uniref:Glycosyltransferase family 4 protein n=1 Tax=Granulicella cerasi TaxID=741063 RepID=A0ABW1ZCV5_9BACT|nr:glycosyltransferase family 4 protein [Granulicella cerasi]